MARLKVLSVAISMALILSSCTTQNSYTGEQQTSKATKGSLYGAVGGALVGVLTGRGENAAIGAVIGAGVGGAIGHQQDKQEAALRSQLQDTGVSIKRSGNTIILVMPSDITFATNKADISRDFYQVLQSVAIVLKKFDNNYVRVAGYTDSTGTKSYNLALSKRRAAAVRNFLQNQGISGARLVNVGYGETKPIASNLSSQGRALNRRVEISLVPINRQ